MSAPTIVLLHGIGGGPRAFAQVEQCLAQLGHRAMSWAHPGYPWDPEHPHQTNGTARTRMDEVAQDLQRWIDQQDLERVVLASHSLGGMVAQSLLAYQTQQGSQRIVAAVLAHTSPAFGQKDGEFQARFIAQRTALLDAGGTMAQLAAALVPSLAGPQADAEVLAQAQSLMAAIAAPTYRATLEALVHFDARAVLASIDVPVLCLGASQDSTAPSAVLHKMASKMPQARFEELPGLGHLAPMQAPKVWAESVHRFLNSSTASL